MDRGIVNSSSHDGHFFVTSLSFGPGILFAISVVIFSLSLTESFRTSSTDVTGIPLISVTHP